MAKKRQKKTRVTAKVKARYKVWPSAYASGALSKCRKVGAANWGNSTKKAEGGLIAAVDNPKRPARNRYRRRGDDCFWLWCVEESRRKSTRTF